MRRRAKILTQELFQYVYICIQVCQNARSKKKVKIKIGVGINASGKNHGTICFLMKTFTNLTQYFG